jgi:hypothetical protein
VRHFFTFTIPAWLYIIVGNAAVVGFRTREVAYQVAPVVRTRTETTRRIKWLIALHWWARYRYEELTDDDWLG